MDGADRLRPAEIKEIVVAPDLAVPGIKAGAAIARFVESERLDHGPHGAVEHEDAFGGEATQQRFFS